MFGGLLAVDHRDNNLLGNLHAVSAIAALHLHGSNKRLPRGNFVVAVVCMIDHIKSFAFTQYRMMPRAGIPAMTM